MRPRRAALLLLWAALVPAQGWAQSAATGSIAGVVRDATGAVLPGVTVEAASPALIEKIRTAVTDGQGNYRILDLRPGIYTVTFTLPGFATVRHTNLELTTGFTATVNAEMRVGAVEETVTVSGASPVVDLQNVRQQTVLTRELWEALPTGKTLQSYVSLTLGASLTSSAGQDVGGVKGDTAGGGTAFTYHGAGQNDSQILLDGMNFQHQSAGGGPWTRTTHQNQLAFEQTTIGAGVSAEIENAGVQINLVPKEGGNSFSGLFQANGSWPRFQSDNLTPELVERGIPAQGKTAGLYDVGFTVGGRIKRDKVWFFFSDRSWDAKNSVPGSYYNATPAPAFGLFPIYTPDLSRPAVTRTPHRNDSIRITWQVATKHKLNLFAEMLSACTCLRPASSTLAPEAAQDLTNPYGAVHLYQASWSYPATNRLLVEAGLSTFVQGVGSGGGTQRVKGVTPMDFPLRDLNANFRYGAHGDAPFPFGQCCSYTDPRGLGYSVTYDERVSLTWITGSHSFKVGMRFLAAFSTSPGTVANETPYGPIRVDMRGGTGGVRPVPAAIQLIPSPDGPESHEVNNGGSRVLMPALYAQDTWTVRRVTLNLGVRFDALNGRWNPLTTAATPWYPSQTLPAVEDSPSWKDLSPRIGAVYDLFGNGKTALKASIGRYVTHATEALNSPGSRLGYGGGTRTWNDVDGDYVPDCDLRNPQANGECDRLANVNFGLARAPSSVFDPDYLEGFGVRPYVWSTTIGLQQELRRGVALNVGYFRTAYGNLTVTDNQAFSPADYTEYCVTAPVNAALGSVGGSRMCGLYDVSPAKFGQVRNLVTLSDDYGAYTNVFNGVDVGVNARFGNGAVLGGGVSTGQTVIDNCDIVKNNPQIEFTLDNVSAPRTDAFCHQVRPFSALTQIKLAGSYPLPWSRLQVSGTFQNLPGPSYGANQTYTSAQIAPSLGRQLSAGPTAIVTVPLVAPDTLFEPRFSQLDLRLTKFLNVSRFRVQGQLDVYNIFNASPVLGLSSTFGAAWRRPTSILGARLLKFGVQVDWS